MQRFDDTPWDLAPREDPMPVAKKGTPSAQLTEAISHLDRLVTLMIEWETDWSALISTLPSGESNPDYDPTYEARIRETPEEIYDAAVLEARNFLKRVHSH